jgi:hypothetical protein
MKRILTLLTALLLSPLAARYGCPHSLCCEGCEYVVTFMKRNRLLIPLLVALLATIIAPARAAEKPNIIVITGLRNVPSPWSSVRMTMLKVDFPDSDVSLQEQRPMEIVCRKSLSLVVAALGTLFAEAVK